MEEGVGFASAEMGSWQGREIGIWKLANVNLAL